MVIKNKMSLFLRFGISFGMLAVLLLWIVRKNDIGNIMDILRNSNKLFFILGMSISITLTVLVSYRLKLLMMGQRISLRLKDSVYLTFVGYFFNNFFPTAIGGDIAKAYYASKKTNNKAASYAAVLTDRLVGFLSCLSMAIIGIIFIGKDFGNSRIIWAVVGVLILLIALMLFLFNKKRIEFLHGFAEKSILSKIGDKISKLHVAINSYRHNTALLIKAYLLALFVQGCAALSIYFFILCLGGDIYLVKLFLIIPLVWAVSMLPSLNGLGVREGAFVYFLKGDIGIEMAASLSLLWLGMIILYGIAGGILHLLYPLKVKPEEIRGGGL